MYSLETERLILRPLVDSDVSFLDYLHSDLDVMRYTIGRTRSHAENIAYIRLMRDLYLRNIGHLLVIRKEDSTPIGRCGLFTFYGVNDGKMDWFYIGTPEAVKKEGDIFELIELGYSFAKPFWGKGYATEAAIAFKNYAFDTLAYEKLSSLVIKENEASIKVAQKLGASELIDCMLEDKPSIELRNVNNE